MDNPKPLWMSKTFIISVLAILIASLTRLEELITSGQAITLMGFVTIVLRIISKEAVKVLP